MEEALSSPAPKAPGRIETGSLAPHIEDISRSPAPNAPGRIETRVGHHRHQLHGVPRRPKRRGGLKPGSSVTKTPVTKFPGAQSAGAD